MKKSIIIKSIIALTLIFAMSVGMFASAEHFDDDVTNGEHYDVDYWNLNGEANWRLTVNKSNLPLTITLKRTVASLGWNIKSGGEYIDYSDLSKREITVTIKNNVPTDKNIIDIDVDVGGRVYISVIAYYNISFSNGGKGASNMPGNVSGHKVTKSTNNYTIPSNTPTAVGYTFKNWLGSDGKTYSPGSAVSLSSNITFTAQWTPAPYTITYNLDGGSVSGNPTSYNIETATFTLKNPTKTGYTFAGWTGSNGSTAQTSVTIAKGSTGNKSYTANWTPITYTVTYNGNGATSGSTASQTFSWNESKALSSNGFKKEYTVTYNANGGTVSKTSETAAATFNGWEDRNDIIYNGVTYMWSTFDAPYYANAYGDLYNAFGYNKYSLIGHYVNNGKGENRNPKDPSGARSYYRADRLTVSNLTTTNGAALTMYANWTPKNITLPTATRTGYTFNGWSGSDGKTYNANDIVTVTSNMTFTAQWTPVIYKVTLNNQGATTAGTAEYWYKYNTTQVVNGETIYYWTNAACSTPLYGYKITVPTRTGYTFGGYFTGTNGSGTQYVDASGTCVNNLYSGVVANSTLYAKWTPTSYKITYNLDGGSVSGNPTSYTIETATFTLNNPTRTGYTFLGWTGSNGSTPQMTVTIPQGSMSDKAYTANWERNEFTIKWVDYDGALLSTDKVKLNDTPAYSGAELKRASTAEFDYTFKGWSPAISPATADVTYTAQYSETRRKYAITFKNEDGTVLETKPVEYGKTPTYTGSTPEKEQTESEVFTFVSWSPVINSVTGEAEYIAMYESSPRKYTVRWMNEGDVELEAEEYEYNAMPSYKGETPEKAKDKQYRYEFEGWNLEIEPVTGDAVYVATFKAIELPPVADLVIETSGCKETQSFVFSVVSDEDATFKPIEVALVGNGSATIKELPTGKYTVTEENGWTWRFSDEYEKSVTVTAGDENKVTFSNINEPTIKKWLSGLAALFK